MRAGAASADITPDDVRNTFVAGFGMGKRATGVHMPLRASAVYLEADDGQSVVLVSLDLVGLLKAWIDRIRARVTAIAGERVVVACTHTHAGPDTLGYWGPSFLKLFPISDGKNPAYMHALVDKVAACVDEAVQSAGDATLRAVSFDGDIAWSRNDRKGGARYDKLVAFAVDNAAGRVATVINYASHPETLWEHNTLLSPDFVGPLRQHIQARTGGEVAYFNGPLGAMLTPDCKAEFKDLDGRIAYIDTLGEDMATRVTEALAATDPVPVRTLEHAPRPVHVANDNWRYRLLERLGLVDVVTRDKGVDSIAHALSFGTVSMATFPGEPSPELGAEVAARMTGEHRMVVGLCEDEFGYILQPAQFDNDEYSYEQTMSLGRTTADTVVAAFGDFLSAPPTARDTPDVSA